MEKLQLSEIAAAVGSETPLEAAVYGYKKIRAGLLVFSTAWGKF